LAKINGSLIGKELLKITDAGSSNVRMFKP
jgi:hypothetical protein